MGGLNGVLGTDLSGLEAYRTALNTVSQNISNATTPSYARRSAELAASFQGPNQASGTGVDVTGIRRIASQFAETRLRAATADQGRADTLVNALTTLQANFPSQGGIATTMNQFFADAKSLSTQPASLPARQTLLSDGDQLAGSFRQVAGNINDNLHNLSQSATEVTKSVNQLLSQLADINQSLRGRSGASTNSDLDNQQAALQKLSSLLGFHSIQNANGTIRIAVHGEVLLDASGANTLTLVKQPDGTSALQLPNGHRLNLSNTGGQLGGTLNAQAQTQAQLQNINRMATVTAWVVNSQQALGYNNSGQQGGALFTLPTPSVVPLTDNTGTGVLNATLKDATKLPANGGPFTLRYDGSQWAARNQATGKAFNLGSGSTLNFRGIEVNVSGTPKAGDRFNVDPVADAATNLKMTTSDPDAIAAAAPYVATAGAMSTSGNVLNMNAGTAEIGAGKVTETPGTNSLTVPSSYFEQTLQLKFTSPTAYQVQTTSGTVITTGNYAGNSGGTIDFAYPAGAAGGKYWQMNVSGDPAAGDTFTLSPGGAQSGENADALGALQSAQTIQGGSLNDAWSYVVDAIGTATQSAQNSQGNAATSVQSAQAARDSISGVSLDQQAGELQLYTQAYEASAKAISTVNQLFQSLLSVV